jgi:hypothetical protein
MQANDLPVVAQAVSPAYRISSHVLTVAAGSMVYARIPAIGGHLGK